MEAMFASIDVDATRRNQPAAIRAEVDEFDEDYILNVSEDDLIAALVQKAQWSAPVLGEPEVASHREIQKQKADSDYGRHRTFTARVTEIVVHLPYSGDKAFFRMQPSHRQWETPQANIRSDCLEIVFEGNASDGSSIRHAIDNFVTNVRFHLDQLVKVADEHNSSLPQIVRDVVQARKKRILNRRNLVSSIGLPLRHRDDSPQTYSIATLRRKADVRMPPASHKAFVPEPALAESEYENILAIMRNMVRVMEASPQAFATMKEEDLRQHFLVQLNGQYQGGATGETFNYEGKTDILIRELERNVFIAECKFWTGSESLSKTIDQMLGYLHWRDTKAAVVVFNRNKDFTNVLAQIASAAKAHACCKRLVQQTSETEWRFIFANKDDPNRTVHLAILAFDIPKAGAVRK